ncbi:MAG: DUF72 domain-containing protein [Aigarchaeota archaeon]|nr:DUF72 domain-containing protein [Aigarchaeota archaeon]MCX8192746.1 DUF72 domain-containing protein [Nitrososphaeria archaeon]MDW7985998.1 DUF72 domain-containing protein [Nitrososphaerota archaeon]
MSLFRVGTSGYSYFWNPDRRSPFKWYVMQGFKTVEINASFYSFPRKSWIINWLRNSPREFDFSIKVHRSITHLSRLGPKSLKIWEKFYQILKPLEEKISFWLFQFPEYFKPTHENLLKIKAFINDTGLGNSAVFEFRDSRWWNMRSIIEGLGAVFCSVDAPSLPREIYSSNNVVYLRMHGRIDWYAYSYSDRELEELAEELIKIDCEKKYVYFNNDHGMLENALKMRYLLEEKTWR